MRLIGETKEEKAAYGFQAFLTHQKIESSYELLVDPATNAPIFRIWVVDEDDYEKAVEFFRQFQADPTDARFASSLQTKEPLVSSPQLSSSKWRVRKEMLPKASPMVFTLTGFLIMVCVAVFFINSAQQFQIMKEKGPAYLQVAGTPIEEGALFDYSEYREKFKQFLEQNHIRESSELEKLSPEVEVEFNRIQNMPRWEGAMQLVLDHSWNSFEKLPPGTLFAKIREGQVWRLISPIFLHGGFLHIFFNMMIVWVFGRPIEQRIGKGRYFMMTVLLAILTNTAQYLMTGPLFYGFSGVAVGLGGFIWMRQKVAPWEGYPIHPTTLLSLGLFVGVIWGLDLVLTVLQFFKIVSFHTMIANTAHIGGGLLGILFGRLPFFIRRPK